MAIARARSVDELYDEVAGYDLVITTDAPLSLALNRRIDEPTLGRFAATPRMLASGEFRPEDRRRLFLETIDKTGLEWKRAGHVIDRLLECWDETGRPEAIREYDRYDTPATRNVLEVVRSTDTARGAIAEATPPSEREVVVIDEAHFTALDRSLLPESYDAVDRFAGGSFDLPPFRRFETTAGIVDAIVENVTPARAAEFAVVLARESRYRTLVESALDAAGIPFHGEVAVADDAGVRAVRRLLRLGHAGEALRVGDLEPILAFRGESAPVAHADKRLSAVDLPRLDPIVAVIDEVEARTFGDVVDVVEDWGDRDLTAFREELDRLGLTGELAAESAVDDLEYYLRSYTIPDEADDEGVLLAGPGGTATVDRPVVFFLGMDESWTHSVPDRPWIDADRVDRQHLERFQALVQNGAAQYYLVRETAAGDPITPCLYFHDLLDREFETFADLPGSPYSPYPEGGHPGFERTPMAVEPETVDLLSQSALNALVTSPRDFLFDRLIETPERSYLTRGNLVHDFAEFAVANPDVVAETPLDRFVDVMLEAMAPFVEPHDRVTRRTQFRAALETVLTYLREHPPAAHEYATYRSQKESNVFADRFGCDVASTIAEQRFSNASLGGTGKVDLLRTPTELVDYKTGPASSEKRVVDRASLDPVDDEPDFQAPMYLAHHRSERPGEDLTFVFLHPFEVVDDAVTGEVDLEDAVLRVPYHARSFDAFAASRSAFDALRAGVAESNDRRKTLEAMGYPAYRDFFEDHALPAVDDADALLAAPVAEAFREYAVGHVDDYVYVKNGADSALKTLRRLRERRFFAEDLDAFEAFLADQLDLVNEYRRTGFPPGDSDRDQLHHPDLVRSDD